MSNLPNRDEYRIKDFVNDLKKIEPTPTIMYDIGSELVYYEVCECENTLGDEETITAEMRSLLQFMQDDYEQDLLKGRLWRAKDTPRAAINRFMRNRPKEFLHHKLCSSNTKVKSILQYAAAQRAREKARLTAFEETVRKMTEDSSKDPEVWNKLRLLLWLTGKYNEASSAFRTAKKLGWTAETSNLVGI